MTALFQRKRNIHIRQHTRLVIHGRSVMCHAQYLRHYHSFGRGVDSISTNSLSLGLSSTKFRSVCSSVKDVRNAVRPHASVLVDTFPNVSEIFSARLLVGSKLPPKIVTTVVSLFSPIYTGSAETRNASPSAIIAPRTCEHILY